MLTFKENGTFKYITIVVQSLFEVRGYCPVVLSCHLQIWILFMKDSNEFYSVITSACLTSFEYRMCFTAVGLASCIHKYCIMDRLLCWAQTQMEVMCRVGLGHGRLSTLERVIWRIVHNSYCHGNYRFEAKVRWRQRKKWRKIILYDTE